MESAEELLRTRSIRSLRELVASLDASASAKQAELQLTVGSKYHDFIQSADAITDMHTKAANLDENLRQFYSCSQQVLAQAKAIGLGSNQGTENVNNGNQNANHSMHTVANSEKRSMDKAIAYDLTSKTVWKLLDKCDIFEAAHIIYLAEIVLHLHSQIKTAFDESFVKNCRSCVVLREVVLEDSALLLSANISVPEKAKIFAAKSLLTKSSSRDLLSSYLSSAKNKISNHLKTLNDLVASMRKDSLSTNDRSSLFSSVADSLDSFIGLLQIVILDVFILFFKPMASVSSSPTGFISLFQMQQASDLQNQIKLFVNAINPRLLSNILEGPSAVNISSLFSVFESWLIENVIEPGSKCAANVLSISATSAEEVSILQKRLWIRMSCLDQSMLQKGYEQDDWCQSCKDLLQSKKLPNNSTSSSQSWEILWSHLFRNAFLAQVERQVHDSCASVLLKVKHMVLSSLSSEGIKINVSSDVWTVAVDSSYDVDNPEQINYLRLHYIAERVRVLLENDILAIAGSSIHKINSNHRNNERDEDSLFATTIFTKMSQLFAHLLIFLREITSLLQINPIQANQNSFYSILCGQVLVGRISWLLLSRGSFINLLLSPHHRPNHKKDSEIGYSSEQQIISAFEIADTNGDGLVTCDEAEEAIQALATESINYEALLSRQTTPNLTFDEFALLILHLQSNQTQRQALHRVRASLHAICGLCHTNIAIAIVSHAENGMKGYHDRIYHHRMQSNTSINKFAVENIKCTWMKVNIPDEDNIEGGNHVLVPSNASISLLSLLNSIASSLGAFTSTGTIESLLGDIDALSLDSSKAFPEIQSNLVTYLTSKLIPTIMKVIERLYKPMAADVAEDLSLQALVDLFVVCESLGPNEMLQNLIESWKSFIDPVDAVLFVPILELVAKSQISSSKMLLQFSQRVRREEEPIHPPEPTSMPSQIVLPKIDLMGMMPSKSVARFSLLALPLNIGGGNKMRSNEFSSVSSLSSQTAIASKPGKAMAPSDSKSINTVNPKPSSSVAKEPASIMSSLGSFGNSFLGTK